MNCYECAKAGKPTDAVATCPHCRAGLCQVHVKESAAYLSGGTSWLRCPHNTWSYRGVGAAR